MKRRVRALPCAFLSLAFASASHAQQEATDVSRVSLLAEARDVRPGQTVLLGLHFELDEHWHIYWDGRNDTGFPPSVQWALPEGVSVGPMLWPAPKRYISPGGILDHVYEGSPTVLVPVTISPDVAPGHTLNIAGEVEWLVCNDLCLPGFGPVSIELSTVEADAGPPVEPARLKPIDPIGRAAARLPKPMIASAQTEALTLTWSETSVGVVYEGATAVAFYPSMASVSLVSMIDDAYATGDTLSLRLASPEDDLSEANERRLVGVLEVTTDAGTSWHLIDFGSDGLRTPADAELISRVRDRVER